MRIDKDECPTKNASKKKSRTMININKFLERE